VAFTAGDRALAKSLQVGRRSGGVSFQVGIVDASCDCDDVKLCTMRQGRVFSKLLFLIIAPRSVWHGDHPRAAICRGPDQGVEKKVCSCLTAAFSVHHHSSRAMQLRIQLRTVNSMTVLAVPQSKALVCASETFLLTERRDTRFNDFLIGEEKWDIGSGRTNCKPEPAGSGSSGEELEERLGVSQQQRPVAVAALRGAAAPVAEKRPNSGHSEGCWRQ